ncbi:alpha/beta hydrolase [Opitutus sp. ER46]|uniref:alpha/beta hydrolase n=1 Tax=Opitutus sp. ER46 TaxID=2161864 RepID=UPI000D30C0B1|nr:alpha/beta hydrolase [Opitutus sp. ER46]PTX96646.1 hypothetical protein DB354_08290 [Opitutus sp. ER46]
MRSFFVLSLTCGLMSATVAVAAAPATAKAATPVEATPHGFPGAQTYVFRELTPEPLRLHVFKPEGWQAQDRRPALMFFFGGGWTRGTPERSAGWARWAAQHGLVGIAPDYRTKERFDTAPLEAVADARAALRWVQDHAAELGIDPKRVVVGGTSAGGHLALWTAITATPPGSAEAEAPKFKPVALVLSSPVSDTAEIGGYTPQRFGPHAAALSAVHRLDAKMPPVLVFHGDADKTVPQRQSLALRDKLQAGGNRCEFVNVPGGSHNFSTDLPEWKEKVRARIESFLREEGLLAR